jgi:hypothetical protein
LVVQVLVTAALIKRVIQEKIEEHTRKAALKTLKDNDVSIHRS